MMTDVTNNHRYVVNKIVFTGDIFRPDKRGLSHQAVNIRWLYNFFKPYVRAVLPNILMSRVSWEEGFMLEPSEFYIELGKELSQESWASLFEYKGASKFLDSLTEKYFCNSFVIGFEIPPVIINRLEIYGIPYLDISIAPIRFLDDLCFEMKSNITRIKDVLSKSSLSHYYITCSAGSVKAQISREKEISHQKVGLVVGQTVGDKSLIKNGKFLTFENFIKELSCFVDSHEKVYYKPHPYDDGNFLSKKILEEKNIEIIDVNIYRLLSQEKLKSVCGISSSCLYEAPFFDVEAVFFGAAREIGPIIYHNIFSFDFWEQLFSAIGLAALHIEDYSPTPNANTLRVSLNEFWGYSEIGLKNEYLAGRTKVNEDRRPHGFMHNVIKKFKGCI